jgi:hypothetical protein
MAGSVDLAGGKCYDRCCVGEQWRCSPTSVKLQIDFDLQFCPPFSKEYQKHEEHQDDHGAVPLSTPEGKQTPLLRRGFALVEPMGSMQTCLLQFPNRNVIVSV